MEIITLTKENFPTEHICCAIADKKSQNGVAAKKEWLSQRMEEDLRFKKVAVQGKVFIEYLPADHAWMPIDAKGYMLINCNWVSGSHKGKGYGKLLLEECERDTAGMSGVVLVVRNKKNPFLSDKSFFLKHGYSVCDTAHPYFELLVKQLNPTAPLPQFKACAKDGLLGDVHGVDIFYTAQCPFTIPYISFIQPVIQASDIPIRTHQITSREEAQNHCCPITTYSVFVNGKFYSNEILSTPKLEKLVASMS